MSRALDFPGSRQRRDRKLDQYSYCTRTLYDSQRQSNSTAHTLSMSGTVTQFVPAWAQAQTQPQPGQPAALGPGPHAQSLGAHVQPDPTYTTSVPNFHPGVMGPPAYPTPYEEAKGSFVLPAPATLQSRTQSHAQLDSLNAGRGRGRLAALPIPKSKKGRFILVGIIVAIIVIAIGLGVGITLKNKNSASGGSAGGSGGSGSSICAPNSCNTNDDCRFGNPLSTRYCTSGTYVQGRQCGRHCD